MSNALTTTGDRSVSVFARMADRFQMDPRAFEQTVKATLIPDDRRNVGNEHIAAFLLVAEQYGLNPFTKEVYAFPTKGGGIQAMVPIDGWYKLANDHPQFDGIEFDDQLDDDGKLMAVTARVYRKDRGRPTCVTEYMVECAMNKDTWKRWPRRMLRHKAAIQAFRAAFSFSGFVDPDEADRIRDVPASVREAQGVKPGPAKGGVARLGAALTATEAIEAPAPTEPEPEEMPTTKPKPRSQQRTLETEFEFEPATEPAPEPEPESGGDSDWITVRIAGEYALVDENGEDVQVGILVAKDQDIEVPQGMRLRRVGDLPEEFWA